MFWCSLRRWIQCFLSILILAWGLFSRTRFRVIIVAVFSAVRTILVCEAIWWIFRCEQELAASIDALHNECLWIKCIGWDVWVITRHRARVWRGVATCCRLGGGCSWCFSSWFGGLLAAVAVAWAALAVLVGVLVCVHWVEIERMRRVSCSLVREEYLWLVLVCMWNRGTLASGCVGQVLWWLHCIWWHPLTGMLELCIMMVVCHDHLLIAQICTKLFNWLGTLHGILILLAFLLIFVIILWWRLITKMKEAREIASSLFWSNAAFQAIRWSECFHFTGSAE